MSPCALSRFPEFETCCVQEWTISQALTTKAAGHRADDAFVLALHLVAGNREMKLLLCTEVPAPVAVCAARDDGGHFDFNNQQWVTSSKGKGKGEYDD
jgi:hypothetical protein